MVGAALIFDRYRDKASYRALTLFVSDRVKIVRCRGCLKVRGVDGERWRAMESSTDSKVGICVESRSSKE